MAVERLEIKPKMLRWAIQRAGFNEEMAIDAFPILSGWLSSQQQPTLSQLKKFSAKFHTPIGYLFLTVPPIEKVPFPMFRGDAGQTDHFDLNLYETVILAYNGVVGNNTHRKLSVSECRGFCLVNERAPYIFVNSADSKSAQLFTLIHEMTHLMLGISAGHAGSEVFFNEKNEKYCDMVAAEFLVPMSILREIWNNDIKSVSRRFKTSELVVARRAHDIGIMSNEEYKDFWLKYNKRPKQTNKNSNGGSFYLTSVKRVGRNFAIHVRNAVNSRQLSYTDAYRLTGLYGKTYDNFMSNNI